MSARQTYRGTVASVINSQAVYILALLALCSAYIQGPLMKIFDFQGALAEMQHFGLHPTLFFAIAVIGFELIASFMVVAGPFRWIGALALAGFTILATFLALRFWEAPIGIERIMAMNAFFEHLGLSAAFILVAGYDLRQRATR